MCQLRQRPAGSLTDFGCQAKNFFMSGPSFGRAGTGYRNLYHAGPKVDVITCDQPGLGNPWEASPKLLKLEKWSPTEQTCSVGKFQVLDNGKQPLGRPP